MRAEVAPRSVSMLGIEGVEVAGWNPPVVLSDDVTPSAKIDQFAGRARSGYLAPPIRFDEPQELLVSGRHFAVVTRQAGLAAASVHTLPRFRWRQAFEGLTRIAIGPDTPTLVAASAGHGNYFHWMMETLAAAAVHRELCPGEPIALCVPAVQEDWKRDALAALGIDSPLVALPADEALVLDAGILTSLTGPDHSFAPHPALLDLMRRRLPDGSAGRSRDRKLYISRLDAGDRRRMINEQELCSELAGLGFEIVVAGNLTIAAQAALFRSAALIVAPHGAALTNLLFSGDGEEGPAVIELFQENYLNRCFLKLCQAKRLHYRALVNPCVSPGDHHHRSTWRADIPLIRRTILG